MKKTVTHMMVAWMLSICVVDAETDQERAAKAVSFYRKGEAAMGAGQYDLASSHFTAVLQLYPKHSQARRQLLYIKSNRKSLDTKQRQSELAKLMIPSIDLERATIQEAVEILSTHAQRESAGQNRKNSVPNFVIMDPRKQFEGKFVTLSLKKIPITTALKYILDQTDGGARFDDHAVVISPKSVRLKQPAE